MAMDFEASEDTTNDAPFLEKPGVYHMSVVHAVENATFRGGDKKGQFRGGFEIEFVVLAGPEAKKSTRVFFRNPDLSHSDQGAFCRKVQTRALEAIAVLGPQFRGKQVTVTLEGGDGQPCPIAGRQAIVKLEQGKDREGKATKFLDLAGANIWHVDDPEAEQCERNQDALKLLPASLRRSPESFKKNGAGAQAAAKSPTPPPAAPAASTGDPIDEI